MIRRAGRDDKKSMDERTERRNGSENEIKVVSTNKKLPLSDSFHCRL